MKPSVWRQGAKASAVITAIYLITLPLRSSGNNLIVGIPVTFLAWWLLAVGLIWVWRKLDHIAWKILFVLFVPAVVVLSAILVSSPAHIISTPTATKEPCPTNIPGGFQFECLK